MTKKRITLKWVREMAKLMGITGVVSFDINKNVCVLVVESGNRYLCSLDMKNCTLSFNGNYEKEDFGHVIHDSFEGMRIYDLKMNRMSSWFNAGWRVEDEKVCYWNHSGIVAVSIDG